MLVNSNIRAYYVCKLKQYYVCKLKQYYACKLKQYYASKICFNYFIITNPIAFEILFS